VIASRTLAVNAAFAPGAASAANLANLAAETSPSGESAFAAGFPPAEAMPAKPSADAVPPIASATVPAPIAPRAGAPPSNRASLTRAPAHEATRSIRKSEVSAPPPVARAPGSPAPLASTGSSAKATDRPLDPTIFAPPSTAQTSSFVAQLSQQEPQIQTPRPARTRSPQAPRPLLRLSGRSTSICRREASRMSR
jgi:hypothetical protein